MPRRYVFADESGDFNFTRSRGATRYFIFTVVKMADCSVGDALTGLRRDLAWEGIDHAGTFHATEDLQAVRDRVFAVLAAHDFRVDTTIFEKPKTQPHLQAEEAFYKLAWFLHFKYTARHAVAPADELLVVAAAYGGTKKRRTLFGTAIRDVVMQVAGASEPRTAFWSAASEPCLQAADYCCWAIQRKWERGDDRSYRLIRDKIRSEHDIFAVSDQTYY